LNGFDRKPGAARLNAGAGPFRGETCKPAASEDASANNAAAQDAAVRSRMEINDDA
jgi:hypothetical protein